MKINRIYNDYMVLQRNQSNHIKGTCDLGEKISIIFQNKIYEASYHQDEWTITLEQLETGGPYLFVILSQYEEIKWQHVYVGDVYLAAGQSNMEMPLKNAYCDDDIDCSQSVFFYQTPKIDYIDNGVAYPLVKNQGWQQLNSNNMKDLSAVVYYFVKNLKTQIDIPVGIVECNKGGTSASCWISEDYLQSYQDLKIVYYDEYYQDILSQTDEQEDKKRYIYQQQVEDYLNKVAIYKKQHPSSSMSQLKKTLGHTPWPGPKGKKDFRRPSGLYSTMFSHVKDYRFLAVLWYQGEEDTQYAYLYKDLLECLVDNWRAEFNNPHLPFYCIQLPNYDDDKNNNWPILREAQFRVSKEIDNFYLIVTIDCGEQFNIHPFHKEKIGKRLAYSVLQHTYHCNVTADSPTVISHYWQDDQLHIILDQEVYCKNQQVSCFQFKNHQQTRDVYPKINGCELILNIETIGTLYYAYTNYPVVNLYSLYDIPVMPFVLELNKNEDSL